MKNYKNVQSCRHFLHIVCHNLKSTGSRPLYPSKMTNVKPIIFSFVGHVIQRDCVDKQTIQEMLDGKGTRGIATVSSPAP